MMTPPDSGPDTRQTPAGPPIPPQPATAARTPSGTRWWVPFLVIALVVGMLSGTLSAVAITNLLHSPADAANLGAPGSGTTVSNVHLDETSAVISAVQKV